MAPAVLDQTNEIHGGVSFNGDSALSNLSPAPYSIEQFQQEEIENEKISFKKYPLKYFFIAIIILILFILIGLFLVIVITEVPNGNKSSINYSINTTANCYSPFDLTYTPSAFSFNEISKFYSPYTDTQLFFSASGTSEDRSLFSYCNVTITSEDLIDEAYLVYQLSTGYDPLCVQFSSTPLETPSNCTADEAIENSEICYDLQTNPLSCPNSFFIGDQFKEFSLFIYVSNCELQFYSEISFTLDYGFIFYLDDNNDNNNNNDKSSNDYYWLSFLLMPIIFLFCVIAAFGIRFTLVRSKSDRYSDHNNYPVNQENMMEDAVDD